MLYHFLGTTALDTSNMGFNSQGSIWQAIGGMAVVFGLLLLFLKLLGKLNRKGGTEDTSVVAVWHLGPKREIQVLRLGEMVHYIYRHEGSMVVLKEESYLEFQATKGPSTSDGQTLVPWKKLFGDKVPFLKAQPSA